ncbi:DNA phosphorothioation-associated protein 4 [Chroococcidiopsis sp. FACHB-1243]|uniref:DNA phosphorothioation-associated protein 4 n=1 Tax=Chroococcidiopsis sp. [FACHB-1243] TaxID=2692781 RepID=UPI001782E2C2|nr:DNA phosphorothioation-associated protein 4 [Chroococcidiopsis sp. [FACHB-1243]]MBD2308134.1 DNA phosphorothioation-associated protein 4 [Chroococcidiopsis sp. [FACHB-1243]]
MVETGRIRVAKDKAELVKALTAADGATGPFPTYADVIVFAAALGAKHKKRVPLGEVSKKEPAPIPQEQFLVRGYDAVINLIAVNETEELKILSLTENHINENRNDIFEEYVNGGLEMLQIELRGAVDYTERLLLILISEVVRQKKEEEEFDLSKFLPQM